MPLPPPIWGDINKTSPMKGKVFFTGDICTYVRTDGQCDSMTESAQWADSVKSTEVPEQCRYKFACNLCEYTFKSKNVLTKHIDSKHDSHTKCFMCKAVFLSAKILKNHEKKCIQMMKCLISSTGFVKVRPTSNV